MGVRWDDYSAAGPAETYRVSSIWNVYETGTAFHGMLGTGFRAPSLAELFFPFGNAALRPERSRGWDFGVRQQLLDLIDHREQAALNLVLELRELPKPAAAE